MFPSTSSIFSLLPFEKTKRLFFDRTIIDLSIYKSRRLLVQKLKNKFSIFFDMVLLAKPLVFLSLAGALGGGTILAKYTYGRPASYKL